MARKDDAMELVANMTEITGTTNCRPDHAHKTLDQPISQESGQTAPVFSHKRLSRQLLMHKGEIHPQ